MAEGSKKNKASSLGRLSNYRYLNKKAMLLCAMRAARANRKRQQKTNIPNMKVKRKDTQPLDTHRLITQTKVKDGDQGHQCLNSDTTTEVSEHRPSVDKAAVHHSSAAPLRDRWEVDSGFCSEASPPVSGRSSPCLRSSSTTVVAIDCEMVGTGPGGRCSEVARCSILDHQGNVLYDKYVRPCQLVTDFRTRWSGIQRHHLRNATPFTEAREEILSILEGKVVVGHAIYHDFKVLDIIHPAHMVRDTSTTQLLSSLVGLPRRRCTSLKLLSSKLLDRKIQAGNRGHCSVEDARASLDLYKLVEGKWEQELQNNLMDDQQSLASSDHYMQDEYWPDDLNAVSE